MKVLHIVPHLGGGVGSVIFNWLKRVQGHVICCLDYANDKARLFCWNHKVQIWERMHNQVEFVAKMVRSSDVVVVHYWDNDMLCKFLGSLFLNHRPECRLVYWLHNNHNPQFNVVPDVCVATSPVVYDQPNFKTMYADMDRRWIWSAADVEQYVDVKRKEDWHFGVGYIGTVDYKKLHKSWLPMCKNIIVPNIRFIVAGENNIGGVGADYRFEMLGHVDDIRPVLERLDVLGYPLREDHYGTCEQVLGEAMAAGVVPVVMNNMAERLIVRHEVNGLVAQNCMEYVACVERLYLEPELRQRLAAEGREWAVARYSGERMAWSWEQLLEEVARRVKR